MRTKALVLSALLVLGAASLRAGETYDIDAAHSSAGFTVTHMVVSEVTGRFKAFSGAIEMDEKDPAKSSVSVEIKVDSIDTDNAKRDDHLRSADFFDAAKHPGISFRSRKVEKAAEGKGFLLTGDLTIRGVTKEVRIPFSYAGKVKGMRGETRAGFKGSLTINRQDFGVSWSKALDGGGLVVSDEVQIDLRIEAVRREEKPAGGTEKVKQGR